MDITLISGLIAMFGWGAADYVQAQGIRSIGTPHKAKN